MDSSVTAALIGLGGVVVGGAVGGFLASLRPNVRIVRGTARLLHADLEATVRGSQQFPLPLWEDRRELLAAELGLADWVDVRDGVEAASALSTAATAGPALSKEEFEALDARRERALAVLEGLSGGWPWTTQIRRRLFARR